MFHIICWGIIGILTMIFSKQVSKVSYFCCWLMLMAVLIERII